MRGKKVELPQKSLSNIFKDLLKNNEEIGKKPAIIYQDNTVTFEELDRVSDNIGRGIIEKIGSNASGDGLVALLIPPSDLRVFGLLGVLKAHYGTLPLENTLPVARIEYMLTNAKPKLIILSKEYENLYKEMKEFCPPVAYIEDLVKGSNNFDLAAFKHPSHLVISYFTSGSTGVPKGVPLTTKSTLNRLMWGWSELPFDNSDKVIHKSSFVFVDSFTEILGTVLGGAPLVVASKDEKADLDLMIKLMNKHEVTRSIMVPTLLNSILQWSEILEEHEKLPTLKTVVTSGEKLQVEVARDFFKNLPGTRKLVNLYGSTEVAGDVTFDIFESIDDLNSRIVKNKNISIGKPIWNSSLYIKKEDGSLAGDGEVGDLYIGGASVCGYYLNSEHSSKFVSNDVSPGNDDPILFESGDNVMVHEGNVMYLGRTDTLFKIRGQRFDLAEVSHVAEELECVKKTVTLSPGEKNFELEIVCFYIGEGDTLEIEAQMKKAWSEFLPNYVKPIPFRVQGDFPKGPTGKVNRQELLEMYSKAE